MSLRAWWHACVISHVTPAQLIRRRTLIVYSYASERFLCIHNTHKSNAARSSSLIWLCQPSRDKGWLTPPVPAQYPSQSQERNNTSYNILNSLRSLSFHNSSLSWAVVKKIQQLIGTNDYLIVVITWYLHSLASHWTSPVSKLTRWRGSDTGVKGTAQMLRGNLMQYVAINRTVQLQDAIFLVQFLRLQFFTVTKKIYDWI